MWIAIRFGNAVTVTWLRSFCLGPAAAGLSQVGDAQLRNVKHLKAL